MLRLIIKSIVSKDVRSINLQYEGFTLVSSMRELDRLLLVVFEILSKLCERVNRLNAGQLTKGTKTKAQ
jgi:hypothetical protein